MKAYEEGYKDFRRGQLSNPYKEGTNKHREWEQGFNKAYFKNLEFVKTKNLELVKERESRRGSQGVSQA